MPGGDDMENCDYLTARLLEIRPETADTNTYLFALENLREFPYLPGQFNMAGFIGLEEAPFSFSSRAEPGSNRFEHTVRRVGNLTGRLAEMAVGDRMMVRGPYGKGWPVEDLQNRDILLVGGGLGIPPLRPLILHVLARPDLFGKVVLIYGARSPKEMLFQKELADWQAASGLSTHYCVDRLERGGKNALEIHEGIVTDFLEKLDLDPLNTLACLCGPEIMMRFTARGLLRLGYMGDQIFVSLERRMRCGTAHCGHCQIGPKFVCQDGPVFRYPDISRFADTLL
jgi:NAD(P)H-flavin reductase